MRGVVYQPGSADFFGLWLLLSRPLECFYGLLHAASSLLVIQARDIDPQICTFICFAKVGDVFLDLSQIQALFISRQAFLDLLRVDLVKGDPLQNILRLVGEYLANANRFLYRPKVPPIRPLGGRAITLRPSDYAVPHTILFVMLCTLKHNVFSLKSTIPRLY
jgi:hypothetical protein